MSTHYEKVRTPLVFSNATIGLIAGLPPVIYLYSRSFSLLAPTGVWYFQEMRRLHEMIDNLNKQVYNPAGLNILWPRNVAFLFVSPRII